MTIKLYLYNTISRQKEEFKPIQKNCVSFYACGPTVYWYQHIGNLRTYIFEDVLKRVLLFNGYQVKHVVNVTDVGHLASDADEGEDKLLKGLLREGLPLTKGSMLRLADKYFQEFLEDFKRLNIIMPDVWCKATEYIDDMIKLIKLIDKNGYAYQTSVGLIFDTAKFPHYSDLGRLKLEQQDQGTRTSIDNERKNPSDFAMWITNQSNHIMQWDSPWGKGFPGWHIECSAMSRRHLGDQFDIHCGGKEHIGVHHTNEIAQAEAATGKHPWVNYWLHAEWLTIPEGKMSKSKGNFIRISDFVTQKIDPLAFRYFCYTAHYRSPLSYTAEAFAGSVKGYNNLKKRIAELLKEKTDQGENIKTQYQAEFKNFINDDLNIPRAIALLHAMMKDEKLGAKQKIELLDHMDQVFALDLLKAEEQSIPKEIIELANERLQARKDKNWNLADEIRAKINAQGFNVMDKADGYDLEKCH
ncbi:MAG: cysteine--tRNA ligase [Spirochaetes bacterium]|nr:cysteine--tRNA ligase [Spirochaetota bacterium]